MMKFDNRFRLKLTFATSILVPSAFFGLLISTLWAQSDEVERGRLLFMEHCAACHGAKAKGDGPVAPALNTKPSDLSMIQKENEKFPYFHVKAFIDGERIVSPHGSREMPIWGTYFRRTRGSFAALDIEALVKYVESIQENKEK